MNRTKIEDRELPTYTKGEEIANMVTHIGGAILGVVATVLCIVIATSNHNVYGIVSRSYFWSINDSAICHVQCLPWT